MSLPSRCLFHNIYGDVNGWCSVNIGWSVDGDGLYHILDKELPTAGLMLSKNHYISLYEFTFDVDFVLELRNSKDSERDKYIQLLDDIITCSNEEYRKERHAKN